MRDELRHPRPSFWTTPVGILVIVLGGGAVMVAGFVVMMKQVEAEKNGAEYLTEAKICEMIDHPERFKGKTLRANLWFESHPNNPKSLRGQNGSNITFEQRGDGFCKLQIVVKMPVSGELPDAKLGESVAVEFICREGKLDSGNEAISVKRP